MTGKRVAQHMWVYRSVGCLSDTPLLDAFLNGSGLEPVALPGDEKGRFVQIRPEPGPPLVEPVLQRPSGMGAYRYDSLLVTFTQHSDGKFLLVVMFDVQAG